MLGFSPDSCPRARGSCAHRCALGTDPPAAASAEAADGPDGQQSSPDGGRNALGRPHRLILAGTPRAFRPLGGPRQPIPPVGETGPVGSDPADRASCAFLFLLLLVLILTCGAVVLAATTYQGNQGLRGLADTAHFAYPRLHTAADPSDQQPPQTGKDIWGQFMRFQMPDHGLFIAGIIRDLAPHADVTCVRISNDWGAGATIDLIEQLWQVQQRLLDAEESSRPDTVVNLSLVIPSDEDLKNRQGHIDDLHAMRSYLRETMGSLACCGVMFVAAAGNEGDSRQQQGRPRPDALYPAAFAYQGLTNLIPVRAVNEHGRAAT